MSRQTEPCCTCTFVEPRRHGEVIVDGARKRPIYLDFIEDDSVIDPACPYHGENGSMVMVIDMTAPTYRVGDREEKLGPPPWKSADPKLVAWEQAHGHDVRLACSMERCQVAEERADRIEEAAHVAIQAFNEAMVTGAGKQWVALRQAMDALKEAVDG